jgi:hypothetical protein
MGAMNAIDGTAHAARGDPRVKLFQLAGLRAGGEAHRAHVLDISLSGARVHCAANLRCGQAVTLMIEHLHVPATVLWEDDHRVGLRFHAPLIDHQLKRIAALD